MTTAKKVTPNAASPFAREPDRSGSAGLLIEVELPTKHAVDVVLAVTIRMTELSEITLSVDRRAMIANGETYRKNLGTLVLDHADEFAATVQLIIEALDAIPTLRAARTMVET